MLAFATAALLLIADPDVDVLKFKDRRPDARGFIVSETEDRIKFRLLLEGSKGQTAGGVTVTFLKSEIASIERGSDKARGKAKKKSDALLSGPVEYEKALRKIDTIPERIMGREALRAIGSHFVVRSTCDDRFVREVTFYLDELYAAYQANFGVERNKGRKVTVYLLTDVDEYTRFQKRKFGSAIRNPAFYYPPPGNFIVAYNLDPKEKAGEIRNTVLRYERKVKEFKKEARRMETDVRKKSAKARREVDAEAARLKREIRGQGGSNMAARLRQVDEWKAREYRRIKGWENTEKKRLKAYRKKADAFISHNRKVLWNNFRFRLDRNKQMFETLFHEAFHAFSHNFLWKGGRSAPRWLEEGLASYYEMSVVEVGDLTHGGVYPAMLALLRKQGGALLPLEKVLRGDPTMFLVRHQNNEDRSNLYYAQSWAIAHYMVGRVPRERIVAYGNAAALGIDPVKAFEVLMGKSIRRVDTDIMMHLQSLK